MSARRGEYFLCPWRWLFCRKIGSISFVAYLVFGCWGQFYLLWPLILFGFVSCIWSWSNVLKFSIPLLALMVVSLGLSEYLVKVDPMQAFYHLHARAWELGGGLFFSLPVLPVIKNQNGSIFIFSRVDFLVFLFCASWGSFSRLCCFAALLWVQGWLSILRNVVAEDQLCRIGCLPEFLLVWMISYSLYLCIGRWLRFLSGIF